MKMITVVPSPSRSLPNAEVDAYSQSGAAEDMDHGHQNDRRYIIEGGPQEGHRNAS